MRLLQGDYSRQIDYNDDPVAQAKLFEDQGARWLHVVDLDGAKDGTHSEQNISVLKSICRDTGLQIELGGGVRSEESVDMLLNAGLARVIVGTRAFEDMAWFGRLAGDYPDSVVLGMDARQSCIAIDGWTGDSSMTIDQALRLVEGLPLSAIVYTDITKDGMLTGPNIEATGRIAASTEIDVIASGGVGSLDDICNLCKIPIAGIIVGRALYEKKFTLEEVLAVVADSAG